MGSIVVIPARMASTRFPGKPLAKIAGREMILRVLDNLPDYETIVATPDKAIYSAVKKAGYSTFLTRTNCPTGTDRLVELSKYISADIYINVQCDEPLIEQSDISIVDNCKKEYYDYVIGAVCRIENDQNDVKCILNGTDLSAISRVTYRQRGIYALNEEDLRLFGQAQNTEKEHIEITRFMELGLPVKMAVIADTPDVNVYSDIQIIEKRLLC